MSNSLSTLSVVSPYGSLQAANTLKQRFCSLSPEIKVMILRTMTAAELIDFRCRYIAFNELFSENESVIIRGVLGNPFYHTISTFYDTVSAPGPLHFKCLKQIARRCDIVETLATAIAEHNAREGPLTTRRMTKILKTYLLALRHFFEEYRTTLTNYAYDRHSAQLIPWVCENLDKEILKAHYNEKIAQRICLTHELVNRILKQQFPRANRRITQPTYVVCQQIHDLIYPSIMDHSLAADIYTFSGLEIVNDILTHTQFTERRKLFLFHFTKTTPAPILTGGRIALSFPLRPRSPIS